MQLLVSWTRRFDATLETPSRCSQLLVSWTRRVGAACWSKRRVSLARLVGANETRQLLASSTRRFKVEALQTPDSEQVDRRPAAGIELRLRLFKASLASFQTSAVSNRISQSGRGKQGAQARLHSHAILLNGSLLNGWPSTPTETSRWMAAPDTLVSVGVDDCSCCKVSFHSLVARFPLSLSSSPRLQLCSFGLLPLYAVPCQ